ncbi:MAG: NADPH-dependent assimilatory sulfite reductase hemoprotein subunit [Gemmatimonadaceae bacterium]|nr:NADPH-dependent assimilatory sulfite reductase hemoprotein subunit [Gloeobacterales cyanobacterium ES-bin-141]
MTTDKRSKVEAIKENSQYLRGKLNQELAEATTHFPEESIQLLKFHGTYQQDDRDQRKELKDAGQEPNYSFMIRTKNPGGYAPAAFYLAMDRLADTLGTGTLRVTTRQGLQLHGVHKANLREAIATIAQNLGTTLGACGDINRNVMAPPAPFTSRPYTIAREASVRLAELLTPHTGAYYEIWQDEQKVFTSEAEVEPIYGKTYLPRKFKIAVAVPGDNSVDIYTNDLGVVPVFDDEELLGYNLAAGGGLGVTHAKPETFPRLADHLGFVLPEDLLDAARAVVLVQRDFGERYNRRHARLKYLIHDRGLDWFRGKVEEYLGKPLEPWRELPVWGFQDYLGWHPQGDGKLFLGIYIENGRIKDDGTFRLKTALRQIVERFSPDLYLSPNHNALLVDILPEQQAPIDAILRDCGVRSIGEVSNAERYAMACPALPTCGLALTESERALPGIIDEIGTRLQELGLQDEKITVRMTGCPNGCARPYAGEIGFVGSGVNAYNLYLGGNLSSTRLNVLYQERVKREEIMGILGPLFAYFKQNRQGTESFGDFCLRRGNEDLRAAVNRVAQPVG